MKYKTVGMKEDLFEKLMQEKEKTGIPANTIIIQSLESWLIIQEQKRKDYEKMKG